jgi:cyclohexanone monooxygenase
MTSFRLTDKKSMIQREAAGLAHLERSVFDPEMRARLTPDFPVGCKRILMSNDYLPIFNRANVELVTEPIDRITPHGIVTRDGHERKLDALIFGTGFKAAEYLAAVDIYGVGGRRLRDDWRNGAEAHLGLTVNGYPNLFALYGPNTNQSGNSIIFVLESQAHYVISAIRQLMRRGATKFEVRADVQDGYNQRLQEAMVGTVWSAGCNSYFKGPAGRISTQFPYPASRYWAWTRRFKVSDHSLKPAARPAERSGVGLREATET